MFGPKRDEVLGVWRKLLFFFSGVGLTSPDTAATSGLLYRRKLLNKELHNLYSAPNIIRMMTSRRMIWAGHVGRVG
jgi:hypothetical protein